MKKSILLSALGFLVLSLSVSWFAAYSQAISYPAAFAPTFGQVTATGVFIDGGAAANSITYGGPFSGTVSQIGNDGFGNILIQGGPGSGVVLYNGGTNMLACNYGGSGLCGFSYSVTVPGITAATSVTIGSGNTALTAAKLGTCNMVSATSCVVTDGTVSATSTILCAPEGSTLPTATAYTGSVITANTSYTVTAAASNSDTWRCMRIN